MRKLILTAIRRAIHKTSMSPKTEIPVMVRRKVDRVPLLEVAMQANDTQALPELTMSIIRALANVAPRSVLMCLLRYTSIESQMRKKRERSKTSSLKNIILLKVPVDFRTENWLQNRQFTISKFTYDSKLNQIWDYVWRWHLWVKDLETANAIG
jgi:hypothetical protein